MKEFKINEEQIKIIGNVLMKLTIETALSAIDVLRSLPLIEELNKENIKNKEN